MKCCVLYCYHCPSLLPWFTRSLPWRETICSRVDIRCSSGRISVDGEAYGYGSCSCFENTQYPILSHKHENIHLFIWLQFCNRHGYLKRSNTKKALEWQPHRHQTKSSLQYRDHLSEEEEEQEEEEEEELLSHHPASDQSLKNEDSSLLDLEVPAPRQHPAEPLKARRSEEGETASVSY